MRPSRAPVQVEGRHDDESPPSLPPAPQSGPKHAFREPQAPRSGRPWSPVPARLRPKSVRAKIVSLLMVPVVSLMALWGFATVTTAQSVSDISRFKEVSANLLAPTSDYITALQNERSAAARYLANPDAARLGVLNTRAKSTDSAAASLRRGIDASSTDTAALQSELPARTDRLTDASKRLPALRKGVTAEKTGWEDAYTAYTETIELGFAVGGALTGVAPSGPGHDQDEAVASEARVVQELSRAREMIAREDAVVGAALAGKQMTREGFRLFTGSVSAHRTLLKPAVDDLRPADRPAYRAAAGSDQYRQLASMEKALEDAGPGKVASGVSAVSWDEAAGSVLRDLRAAERKASTTAAGKAEPFSFDVIGSSGVAVVLGLAGVLLSLLISMQIGRGLVVELVGMRNSALEMAGHKLPQSLRRLHSGEEVDIDAEAPVQRRGDDEIGQVGSALNAVHRAAIKAAAERAEVLSGISGVYVKLARRSQVLLHRQLSLLDSMERRVDDPAELEDLFRLDHLTTRMRRHAESLIILSGAAPVRGWRRPVPMLDVVRAAVAEVEDFTRVEVRVAESVRVSGAAVADLTHLVAELVENAVVFSPPHTKVRVRGERVGTGLALEIEDRGLGMSRESLEDANRKIADASQVDLLDTDRLGLFVVNRLAHRRDIQVSLQRSAYGGVTAVVLVPEELLERDAPAGQPGAADGRPPEHQPQPGESPVLQARRTAAHRTRERVGAGHITRPAGAGHGAGGAVAAHGVPEPGMQAPPGPLPIAEPERSSPPQEQSGTAPAPQGPAGTAPAPHVPSGSPPQAPSGSGPQAPADHPSQAPAGPGEPAPLPRRVRQASLAPQLRDEPDSPTGTAPYGSGPATPSAPAAQRTPDRARATMAALRSGWLSGGGADEHARGPAPGEADGDGGRPGAGHTAGDESAEERPPSVPRRDSGGSAAGRDTGETAETPSQGDDA
ncbi:nitrate- and nitrite sensing domain-containing protein [Streptomyces sp. WMMB 322]|uniref:sensor histidine kinase n=1 Tax=Streptomyces sp. WMMB 322 TaxID=1286821 RepID=UPI0008238591|nr:nitrate- and nitrite sensing domain-containing protein [Streptomyces sp. WMMB 322]SCK16725.1 HAMP domain-containing protein [Streptomyces sp. WMMB 322]